MKSLLSVTGPLFVSCLFFNYPLQASVLFNYPNFASTSGLTLVGNTAPAVTADGTVLRLTNASNYQSGAAYSTASVPLGANDTFSTNFQFRFTETGGIDPADGITLVLAASPSGLGQTGGGLGYEGVPNSLAIEFDTFENGGNDTSSNHVAIDTDGVLTNTDLTNLYGVANCTTGTNLAAGCMSNGHLWSVTVNYNGSALSLTAWDTTGESAPFTVYSALPISLESYLGSSTAYVGFTGSTGGGFENEDILNWEFANTATIPSTSTPEPASWTLLLAGVTALPLAKRLRKLIA